MVTDEELVQAMANGDQAAFEAFIHRFHGLLLGYLDRMLGNSDKAEDFVQETFIRLIRQLKQGKIPEQIRPWLYRVASNICKDYWKSKGYRLEQNAVSEFLEQKDERPAVIEIFERQETRKELLQTLNTLPEVQRQIVLLRFYQDLKLQEIAEVLEISLSSVKTQLYNALKKLKKRFIKEAEWVGIKEGKSNERK